jgi:hypothetical protein
MDWTGYGTMDELRTMLGLSNPESTSWDNIVLVSLDTEFRGKYITEVGVTTLDVREVKATDPGHYLRNWLPKMKHHHFITPASRPYLSSWSLFGDSKRVTTSKAREELCRILQNCVTPSVSSGQSGADLTPPRLVLVGQSIRNDILIMKNCPDFELDLGDHCQIGAKFATIMDTFKLTRDLRKQRIPLPAGGLGPVARHLGVDPVYHDLHTLRGVHNASNDAAYAMMSLLLHAVKFPELLAGPRGPIIQPAGGVEPERPMRQISKHAGHTAKPRRRRARYTRSCWEGVWGHGVLAGILRGLAGLFSATKSH